MDYNCRGAPTEGGRQRLLRDHSIGAQGFKRLTQLSVLAGPDVGRDLFSVKQDGALPERISLAGTRRGVSHESNLHHLGKRLQLGEFHKMASSNILSS